jgi:stage V sporulation protein AA
MTNDTLYLKIEQNIEVHNPAITLGDIANVVCSNKDILNRIKTLKIVQLKEGKKGRYVLSVMKVVAKIHEVFPGLEINNIGETDFIITYEIDKRQHRVADWIKTIFVCFVTFFGAAFTIMTFNNDVDVPKLFAQLYTQFTGQTSNGYTILEITYSIGLGIGVLVFFNHFGPKKLTKDPTPIEVEMRVYEDDVNKTLIEESCRKGVNRHVD